MIDDDLSREWLSMKKLFISYRSINSDRVNPIVTQLSNEKDGLGTHRYRIWQDKTGILPARDWWHAIVDGIIDCEYFVFMVSQESVKNDNCRAELSYARKRNRPIIPVVLPGEFSKNPVTDKNDIAFWQDIPDELNQMRTQFLFYDASSFLEQFEDALKQFEREPANWQDLEYPRPPDPRHVNDTNNNAAAIYDDAWDDAFRLDFEAAEQRFQRLLNSNAPDFAADAKEWITLLREYKKILEFDSKESTRYQVRGLWQEYQQKFPKRFIALFDPKDFAAQYGGSPTPLVTSATSIKAADKPAQVEINPSSPTATQLEPDETPVRRKLDPTITAALITAIATIGAAVIGVFAFFSTLPLVTPTPEIIISGIPPTPTLTPQPEPIKITSENCPQDLTAIFDTVEQDLAAANIVRHPKGSNANVRCDSTNQQIEITLPDIKIQPTWAGNFSIIWLSVAFETWGILAEPTKITLYWQNTEAIKSDVEHLLAVFVAYYNNRDRNKLSYFEQHINLLSDTVLYLPDVCLLRGNIYFYASHQNPIIDIEKDTLVYQVIQGRELQFLDKSIAAYLCGNNNGEDIPELLNNVKVPEDLQFPSDNRLFNNLYLSLFERWHNIKPSNIMDILTPLENNYPFWQINITNTEYYIEYVPNLDNVPEDKCEFSYSDIGLIYLCLAQIKYRFGDFKGILKDVTKANSAFAFEIDESFKQYFLGIGYWCAALPDREQAIKNFESAQNIVENNIFEDKIFLYLIEWARYRLVDREETCNYAHS
jgi:hypothetical protein